MLYGLEALTLERLYVLVFVISIVSTVFGPALASTVPLLAPRAHLTAANALIQSTTNIGLLIGPAVCGVGIAMIGAPNVLYLDAATFMVSAMCLMPIRLHETLQARAQMADRATILQDIMVGFRFVFMAGMAGFGWLADAIGPTTSLVGIGMLLLGTAAVATLFSRRQPVKTAHELRAA